MRDYRPAQSGAGFEYWTTFLTDAPPVIRVSAWSPALEQVMLQTGVERIAFRADFFAGGGTLAFLRPFAGQIRDVSVDGPALAARDAAVLHDLPRLEALSVPGDVSAIDFARLPSLARCVLEGCSSLGNVAEAPALADLGVFRAPLADLRAVADAPQLKKLFIAEWRRLASLDGLQESAVETVEVRYVPRLESISAVSGLRALRELTLQGAKRVQTLAPIGELPALRVLQLTDVPPIASWDFVAGASGLVSLRWASVVTAACSVAPLTRLEHLTGLGLLKDAGRMDDLERIGEMTSLTEVSLGGAGTLDSLAFLRSLVNLERLFLSGTRIRDGDLRVLLELPRLREVSLQPAPSSYTPSPGQVQALLDARRIG